MVGPQSIQFEITDGPDAGHAGPRLRLLARSPSPSTLSVKSFSSHIYLSTLSSLYILCFQPLYLILGPRYVERSYVAEWRDILHVSQADQDCIARRPERGQDQSYHQVRGIYYYKSASNLLHADMVEWVGSCTIRSITHTRQQSVSTF